MRRVTIWLICLGALAAIPVAVPEAAPAPGTRIRLLLPPALIKPTPGTLLQLTADSLAFRPDGTSEERLQLPLSAVSSFELSRGKKGNAGKGAKIGLVVGLVIGLGAALSHDEAKAGSGDFFQRHFGWGVSTGGVIVLGVVGGSLDGALIGALIRTEKWKSVDPATLPPRVGALGVPEDRLALRVRLARF
jgi:hypothetical protein